MTAYGRAAFTGAPVDVLGNCFLPVGCALDVARIVTPALAQSLAQRARDSGLDPVTCAASPPLTIPSLNVRRSDPGSEGLLRIEWGRFVGQDPVTRQRPVAEPIGFSVDLRAERISAIDCQADPVGPTLGPLPTATGTRYSVSEALDLVWDLYLPYLSATTGDMVGWESVSLCLAVPDCTLDVDDYLTPAFKLELLRRLDDVSGMVDLVACAQNLTVITGRDAVEVSGDQAVITVHDWWDRQIRVAVDLDSRRVSDLTCPEG